MTNLSDQKPDEIPPLETGPVTMPELPATLKVSTVQQFKAIGDPTRAHILDIIKHEPVTAKQISERLKIPPGTIGHHLQVLEAAGLAQIVARRLVHGIVAKYYTRTASLFLLESSSETTAEAEKKLNLLTHARDEFGDALVAGNNEIFCQTAFPHARISSARAEEFRQRLFDLIYEFATDPPDPDGQVYALCVALFLAPPYLQSNTLSQAENE